MALSPTMNVMLRAAEKAGKSLIRDFGEVEQLQVSRKGPGDFVTAADHRSEEIIFTELSKARPDYGFLMEERGAKGDANADYRWLVDPLDGTMNFLHGIPHWNISIALEYRGDIIAGIVFDPVKDELFRAEKGGGAFIKNRRIRVSGRNNLDQSLIIHGGVTRRPQEDKDRFNREFIAMQSAGVGMRRNGAGALDLCYVAAGRVEGFWERHLKPWDVAAGLLIVKEAGGSVGDIDNKMNNPVQTGNVLATNAELFEGFKSILTKANQDKNAA